MHAWLKRLFLEVNIGDISLDVPVMNAACSVAKTFADVEALCETRIGAVLIGSKCLPEKRTQVGE
jgi:dihydroorotate dehydrogenase